MSGKKIYTIWVAVHKGDPSDFSKYRHTALWFVPAEGSQFYYHVRGSTGDFRFEQRKDFNPTTTQSFATKVEVGQTRRSLSSSELSRLMAAVPVDSQNPEFNCQQWVEQALRALYHAGYLTEEDYFQGFHGMVDAAMEAEDEDIAF